MRIEAKHLQQWIQEGVAFALPSRITNVLIGHLEKKLPWSPTGTRLDWDTINGTELNLSQLSEGNGAAWLSSTSLRDDAYLIFVLGRNEPCFACKTELGIASVDYIFSGLPGIHYLFGGDGCDGSIQPRLDHFAEYDGMYRLVVAT